MTTTRIFPIDAESFDPDEVAEPAKILADGGIVGFPTETVYGLGCSAHKPEAVHRLREIKERPSSKPLSIHIADFEDIAAIVPEVPQLARTLADLYWPGPLTLVIDGHTGSSVGIRFPSHPVARELIRQTGAPVLAPSANRAGQEAAIDAASVLSVFDGIIDGVVDSGPVAIRQASSVVRIEGDRFQVLREGIITEEMIRRALRGKTILFVCTGNSCRSPMAEGLLRNLLAERLQIPADDLASRGFRIISAGIAAFSGGSASDNAVAVMEEQGIDISPHRSSPVTHESVDDADLIIALSPSHRWQLLQWDPALESKTVVIRELGVLDPIGGDRTTYRECAAQIEQELKSHWLDKVWEL